MFDTEELPPPPATVPPEEVIDCLVDDPHVRSSEPVRWSEYLPDGLLADLLAQPAQTGLEHREFESLERIGGWERVIAWAQAQQLREITSFMEHAEARNAALGAYTSQAHDSAVAEVGLMLRVSARTAASRVNEALSLCTRLPGTLAALEAGRITLAKARIIDTETMNLSDKHTAQVEAKVLAKARQQTPGQLRAATRRAVLTADPAAAKERATQAQRERGVQMWPEPDGMATLSAYLPAAEAVGVYAVLDEYARRSGGEGDERSMDARRGDALVDLALNPPATAAQAPTPVPLSQPTPQTQPAVTSLTPLPPWTLAAGAYADAAAAAVGWMCESRSPTPRCSAPTTSPANSPATAPSPPPSPATSPPGAPGGASSPTPTPADPSTTAPPATSLPPT
jgi:hypothetical protein